MLAHDHYFVFVPGLHLNVTAGVLDGHDGLVGDRKVFLNPTRLGSRRGNQQQRGQRGPGCAKAGYRGCGSVHFSSRVLRSIAVASSTAFCSYAPYKYSRAIGSLGCSRTDFSHSAIMLSTIPKFCCSELASDALCSGSEAITRFMSLSSVCPRSASEEWAWDNRVTWAPLEAMEMGRVRSNADQTPRRPIARKDKRQPSPSAAFR